MGPPHQAQEWGQMETSAMPRRRQKLSGSPHPEPFPFQPPRVADSLTSSPKRSQDAEPGNRPGTRVPTGDMLLASGGTVPHNPPQQMNGPKAPRPSGKPAPTPATPTSPRRGIVTFLKCQRIQGLFYFIKIIITLKVTLFLQLLIQNSSRPCHAPPPDISAYLQLFI